MISAEKALELSWSHNFLEDIIIEDAMRGYCYSIIDVENSLDNPRLFHLSHGCETEDEVREKIEVLMCPRNIELLEKLGYCVSKLEDKWKISW